MTETRALVTRLLRGLSVTAVASLAVAALGALPAAAEGVVRNAGSPDAITDSYIVVYRDAAVAKPGATDELTKRLAAKHSARITYRYGSALRGFAATMSKTQAARLAADPAVDYVSQNQQISITGTQSNPPSWGLDRIDQRNRPLDNSYTFQNTASNVHVYVIDRHPDQPRRLRRPGHLELQLG
ncbi:S8 family serine peptidase [Micromonospora sp. NPDC006766]|uniref:S8 family serine peptidase n=1 Tax=Micromonospora sp. NPDC006766 TaxID=3154778 RepID=UPI0033C38019